MEGGLGLAVQKGTAVSAWNLSEVGAGILMVSGHCMISGEGK